MYDTITRFSFEKVYKRIQFLDKSTLGYQATILVISKGLMRLKKEVHENTTPLRAS